MSKKDNMKNSKNICWADLGNIFTDHIIKTNQKSSSIFHPSIYFQESSGIAAIFKHHKK